MTGNTRRVLLAFLGTNDYEPCNYVFPDGRRVAGVRFVQEAIARTACTGWAGTDRVVVFLTDAARDRNWDDDGHVDRATNAPLPREGLETRLNAIPALQAEIRPVAIPEGRTEQDLWTIFTTVLDQLAPGAEVLFDITHSFRSLPLLVSIILIYARAVKNVTLARIYYGAVEALGPLARLRQLPLAGRDAPVFDLTPFVHLLDWARAARNFLTFGQARGVQALVREATGTILRETRGQDATARALQGIADQLGALSAAIQACRGHQLVHGFQYSLLREQIAGLQQELIAPLNPLLGKIRAKIAPFADDDLLNGLHATRWCVEHGLVQQAVTLLQETIVGVVVREHVGTAQVSDKKTREWVASTLSVGAQDIPEEEWTGTLAEHRETARRILGGMDGALLGVYDQVTQLRNDLNHGGFLTSARRETKIRAQVREYLEAAERLLLPP